jgi:diketogulonate reductase-like aldo/keto reductase
MADASKSRVFRGHDIQETIKNIVAAVDRAYIKTVGLSEFEKSLIEEVHFLVPYNNEEMKKAENYIHQHLKEL